MLSRYLLGTLLLVVPTLAFAQARTATPSVEGVWKIAEIVTTGANAVNISNPQPSLIIFTGGHYSYLSVNGTKPRPKFDPPKDPNKPTDAEKIARFEQWDPFTAQAGTYEIKGTTLTRHPVVAKNVAVMTTNPPIAAEFRLEGNNLWLTTKAAAGQPASETRTKLVRVK
jgi:hypothetical protein